MCEVCGIPTHVVDVQGFVPANVARCAALYDADCRFYLAGAMLSMMADNIEHVITYWVIWQKFHSPLLVGFEVISHWTPFLFFSVFASGLADRHDCRRVIQVAQVFYMCVSIGWGFSFLTNSLTEWAAAGLLVLHGTAGAIWQPAEQLMLHDIVGPVELPSAVRLNAMFRSLGILLGPVVGSVLLGGLGSLFIGASLQPVMPDFAEGLGIGKAGVAYGALLFANGLGGVLGGLLLETTRILKPTVRSAMIATAAFGSCSLGFALSHSYLLSLSLLVVGGMGSLASQSIGQTVVQLLAPLPNGDASLASTRCRAAGCAPAVALPSACSALLLGCTCRSHSARRPCLLRRLRWSSGCSSSSGDRGVGAVSCRQMPPGRELLDANPLTSAP
jgi:MFS family permease